MLTDVKPTFLEEIKQLLQQDLAALNISIVQNLHSSVELIQQVGQHIVEGGGKRLRPILVLLTAKALGYSGEDHIKLASIIEYIHTATLLHDDVVDGSTLRRGRKTANAIWGNQASVLVGDFLYSRAFQMMERLQSLQIMQVLANATNMIAEGEVLQLMNSHDPAITEDCYMEVIRCKTAILFAAAAQLGAIVAKQPVEIQTAMTNYGLHLGLAFQLIDDLLDYTASSDVLGKNIGDDLAEGKATLPLIYAMRHAKPAEKELIEQAIKNGGLSEVAAILQIIHNTNAFAYIRELAQQQIYSAKAALINVPNNIYHNALIGLADFAINRDY